MVSGGSSPSWSVTWEANTVSVHDSPIARVLAGSSVNVVGPPVTVAATLPVVEQSRVNHDGPTSTGSLNVTRRFAVVGKSVAALAGTVLVTLGAASGALHGLSGEAVLRGVGAPAEKSELLLSVSVQPPLSRSAAVSFDRVGAAAEPS